MDVATRVVRRVKGHHALDDGVVGARQVGRAADHLRNRGDQPVQRRTGVLARGGSGFFGLSPGDVGVDVGVGVRGQVARHGAFELGLQVGARQARFPDLAGLGAPAAGGAPGFQNLVGDGERRRRPAHRRPCVSNLIVEQGVAVAVGVAFPGPGALRDQGLAGDHGRPVLARGPAQGGGDLAVVVAVHRLDGPAGGLETGQLVAGLRDRGLAVNGGVVVVEQHGQAGQFQPAGQADRFVADTLHQATVAGHNPGAVVDQSVAEAGVDVALRHSHADGRGQALAQRPGGGLDARGVAVLRMPRCVGAQLPKIPDLLHRHGLDPGQMQQGVEQHRAMARRQHKPVTVGPVRARGVVLQKFREQHCGDVSHAHRHALVAGFGLVDRVHGKHADGVGHNFQRRGHRSWRSALRNCGRRLARGDEGVKKWRPNSQTQLSMAIQGQTAFGGSYEPG